ncbi:MAG: spermidine synthase [Nitrospinae bacterium CG11_big_fil_rev_8_21_14_0_20_45_15]|nr:MAG: spermidine synthase [Nitrospinae bacterium CG11_big_fil_rev_8_21_14_0_20_45_15]
MKRSPLIYFLFFASGISALTYEIVWARMLTLSFGHTVYSVSVTLSAFMAGLGLGAFYFGPWIDALCKTRRGAGDASASENEEWDNSAPLLVYGWIEIGIAITSALLSLIFSNFSGLYSWVHTWLPDSVWVHNLVKAAMAFGSMVVPATLMGATLPIISKYAVTSRSKLGAQIGFLYGLNTLGAAVGALVTGFFMIGTFGVLQTVLFASFVNLMVGIGSIRIYQEMPQAERKPIRLPDFSFPSMRWEKEHRLWIGISFLCGFTALAYEVLWTRLLVFSISSTVYSFSMMLGVFLFSIVIGSLIAGFLNSWLKDLRGTLAVLQIGAGLFVVFSIYTMDSILSPPWNSYNLQNPIHAFTRYFLDSSALMLVPTALIGMSFPILIKIVAEDRDHIGQGTGWIYAFNTLGAIMGSLLAGFLLLPKLGVQNSLAAISALNMLAGVLLFRTGSYLTPAVRKGLTVVFAALVLFVNMSIPSGLLDRFFMRDSAGKRAVSQLLFFEEGLTDTVAVFKDNYGGLDPEAKRLITNGISMSASNKIATRYMKLFAYVPILLSEHPDDVLVVCFGTGQTVGAAGAHPFTKAVTAVDLSPGIVRSGKVFQKENHDVLNNPKVDIVLEDGRNYLLTTDKRYDVITSEPPPPRTAATVNLYTREYYESARNRLKPGGIVAQWIPLHSQGEKEVDMHFKTFLSVFPHAMGWLSVANEILIIGSESPITLDFEVLKKRFNDPKSRALFSAIEIPDIHSLLSNIWYLEDEMQALGQGSPEITDNRPYVEFYLDLGDVVGLEAQEKYVFNRSSFESIAERIKNLPYEDRKILKSDYEMMDLYQRGVMYANRGQLLAASHLEKDSALLRYHLQAGEDHIQRLILASEEEPEKLEHHLNLGHAYFQMGDYEKSIASLEKALSINPDNPYVNLYMGYSLMEMGKREPVRKFFKLAAKNDPANFRAIIQETALADLLDQLDLKPDSLGLILSAAQFYNMKKDYEKSLEYSLRALEMDANNVKALQSILFSYRSLGIPREVIMYGERLELLDPEDMHMQFMIGEMYAKTLHCQKALPYLRQVLKKDDTYPNAQKLYDLCESRTAKE